MRSKFYIKIIKPLFDLVLAIFGFIILFPVFLIITILLYFANQGKPFFVQYRPGKNSKIFKIIKFKTMNDFVDEKGNLLPDEKRLTRIGNWVRKTSLDEIPQLLNVIKGDMSLIGPRPLLVEYMELYTPYQNRRHEVKPGITGWAQINGRNSISWEKKFDYDVYYVDHISFLFDMKILFKTLRKVIIKEGISAVDHVTIEPYAVTNKVVVFGAGGHSRVIIDAILCNDKIDLDFIVDDNPTVKEYLGYPVYNTNQKDKIDFKNLIIAIGDNSIREKIANKFKVNYATIIHPKAIISKNSKIDEGSQILAGAIVNPNSIIGKHTIINTSAVIEHDCKIGNFSHIAPNATLGGGVSIGDSTLVGIGAVILPSISIGTNVVIGAGSVVVNDIPNDVIVVGNPAKILRQNE